MFKKNKSQNNSIVVKKPFSWMRLAAKVRKDAFSWLLIGPSLVFLFVFGWEPLVRGIVLAFYRTRGFDMIEFAGLQNFRDVVTDSLYMTAVSNTFSYAFWAIVMTFFTPIIVAIILNEIGRGKNFFRLAVYFPVLVPGIVGLVMWRIFYDPSSAGLFNTMLVNMGMEPFGWLQEAKWTIPLITASGALAFGGTTILYLADLQSVNLDLYEAASLDGAGFFSKIWNITLPHMSGLIRLFFILLIIGIFQIFMQPLVMTGGGPNDASLSLQLIAYRYAFEYFQIGRSTAVSVITCIFLIVLTLIYWKYSKRSETE